MCEGVKIETKICHGVKIGTKMCQSAQIGTYKNMPRSSNWDTNVPRSQNLDKNVSIKIQINTKCAEEPKLGQPLDQHKHHPASKCWTKLNLKYFFNFENFEHFVYSLMLVQWGGYLVVVGKLVNWIWPKHYFEVNTHLDFYCTLTIGTATPVPVQCSGEKREVGKPLGLSDARQEPSCLVKLPRLSKEGTCRSLKSHLQGVLAWPDQVGFSYLTQILSISNA